MAGRKTKVTDELRQQLAARGYTPVSMEVSGVPKVTLWKQKSSSEKEWEPSPNLPGDPYSLQKYLSRGFLLAKPGSSEIDHPDIVVSNPAVEFPPEPETAQGVSTARVSAYSCDVCDGEPSFATGRGLKMHKKKSGAHKQKVLAVTA